MRVKVELIDAAGGIIAKEIEWPAAFPLVISHKGNIYCYDDYVMKDGKEYIGEGEPGKWVYRTPLILEVE